MKLLRTCAAVGRADLLRVYADQGKQALEQAAGALGYERRPARLVVESSFHALSSTTLM